MTSLPPEPPSITEPDADQSTLARSIACIAIIVIATIATLWPVVKCDFTSWDDPQTVSENARLKPPTFGAVIHYWTHAAMGLYVPVTYTVWTGIACLSPPPLLPGERMQLDPALFHGTNLALHVSAALVAWEILRRLLKHDVAACIGAILFAIHPVQVEPVAWVSGLKDVLSGLFALVAIWQYIRFTESPPRSNERTFRYLLVLAAAGFAMLSKPSSMVLPLILGIIDYFLLRRAPRQIVRSVAGVILIVLPCTVAAAVIQHPSWNMAIWQRPVVVLDSLSFYTLKLLWPVKLAPDYGRRPGDIFHYNLIWFCWIIPVVVAIAMWVIRRRSPQIVAGVLIFVAGALPTLGFVSTLFQHKSTVADHYLYLSMLGIALVLGAIVVQWKSTITNMLAIVILAACAIASFRQTWHWQNTFTLFSHTVEVSPRSWAGRVSLAAALVDKKQYDQAEQYIHEALEIEPSPVNYLALGRLYLMTNRSTDAIAPLQKSLELEPGLDGARLALATAYTRVGRTSDASRELEQLLREQPDDPNAKQMLQQLNRP